MIIGKIRRLLFIKSLVLLLLFVSILLKAQSGTNPGLLLNDTIYDTLPLIEKERGVKFPIIGKCSLKKFCPRPGDQGNIGACVGWAAGYHALTISKAIQDSIKDACAIQTLAHSASYIYNQIKQDNDCEKGAYLSEALFFLKKYGTPLSSSFKNSKFDCNELPNNKINKEALNNRIKNFYPIFKSKEVDSIKIQETKHWIARDKPVIIGINLTNNFDSIASKQKLWSPNLNAQNNMHHAMVVIGYEDGKREFELLNSYGPNWGNSGFINIKYDDYAKLVKYAFVLDSIGDFQSNAQDLLNNFSNTTIFSAPLSNASSLGESIIRRVQYREDDSHFFEEVKMHYNEIEQYYEPTNLPWELGSQYQIIAKNVGTGNHLVVFSLDATNDVISILPSKEPIENLMATQNTEVIIPEKQVLGLKHKGKDYVCMLFSNQPIDDLDFKQYLLAFKNATGNFSDRLQQVFGHLLINSNKITYEKEVLDFNYEYSGTNHFVVPLILTFDVE